MSVFSFTQNPIARAETAIQQRPVLISGLGRVLRYTFYVVMPVLSLGVAGIEIVAAVTHTNPDPLIEQLSPVIGVLVLVVGLFHFRLMFGTLAMTVAAMERERKHDQHWDTLILTGIPSRSIVLGKWWAIVRTRWRAYAWLAVVRAGVAIWFGAYSTRTVIASMASYYSSSANATFDVTIIAPTLFSFVLAALFIIAMTMLNLLFTAACGVYAGIAFKRGALAAAIITRLAMIVGLSIGLLVIFCQISAFGIMSLASDSTMTGDGYSLAGVLGVGFSWGMGTLYDNGVSLASAAVSYGITAEDMMPVALPYSVSLLAALIAAGFYGLLTIVALFMGQAQAERFGALKSVETKGK